MPSRKDLSVFQVEDVASTHVPVGIGIGSPASLVDARVRLIHAFHALTDDAFGAPA